MKLGFIGTGEITKAVVIGILGSKLKFKKIYLSERNKKISSFLRRKNKVKSNYSLKEHIIEKISGNLIKNLNNKNRTLSDELNDLRNVAVDESIYETIDEEDY